MSTRIELELRIQLVTVEHLNLGKLKKTALSPTPIFTYKVINPSLVQAFLPSSQYVTATVLLQYYIISAWECAQTKD